MDPFLGEIRMFGFNYAPYNWAFCDGSPMLVSQNTALYALVGNVFGGNTTQFNLPKLNGRAMIGVVDLAMGAKAGTETVTLTSDQMPPHTHSVNGETITTGIQTAIPSATVVPSNAINTAKTGIKVYSDQQSPLVSMSPMAIASAGGSQAHENRQPYLVTNFCICTDGEFPSFD